MSSIPRPSRPWLVPCLSLASLTVLSAPPEAQEEGGSVPASGLRTIPTNGLPVVRYVHDVATGVTRPLAAAEPLGGGVLRQTTTCFENDASFGFTSLTNNPGEELVDWGVKTCGSTGVVEQMTIGYYSDPLEGLADFSVALYSGTTGFGVLGKEERRITLRDQPALFATIVLLTIDLRSDPVCLPDGPIGWGFRNDDGDSAVLLGLAPNVPLGIIDALDVYSGPAPTGVYTGTYNFGAGNPFGTLVLTLEENDGAVLASSTVVNGSGTNPLALQEVAPAVLGKTWVARVDPSVLPAPAATIIVISAGAIAPLPTRFGELLIDLGAPSRTSFALGTHFVPVPKNLALVGTTVHTQGALVEQLVLPVGFVLTNGLDVTFGF